MGEERRRRREEVKEEKKEEQRKSSRTSLSFFFNFPSHTLSVMLAMVSGEGSKDRSDRVVLTPWLKFLWEAFRHVLDILRNNSKLELLYQEVAKRGNDGQQ